MSEQLSSGPAVFFKFKEPQDTLGGTFEGASFDQPGKYGKESVLSLSGGSGTCEGDVVTGDRILVTMNTSLRSVIKDHYARFIPGETRLNITFTGKTVSKKDPSKSYKTFDVQADGPMVPKNVVEAAKTLGKPAAAAASAGDASFDPKKYA